jgi:DNA polymerase I
MNINIKFIGPDSLTKSDHYHKSSLQECLNYCNSKKILAIDTETEGFDFLNDRMTMFQIGDENTQFVIDTREVNISELRHVIENPNIIKVLHNAKFDYKFIKRWVKADLICVYDTMLQEKILNCGKQVSVSLAETLKRRLNLTLSKEERSSFLDLQGRAFTESQIKYGAMDVIHLLAIREQQISEIQTLHLGDISDLENEVVTVFAEIEYEGILLDKKSWGKLSEYNLKRVIESIEALDNAVVNHPQLQMYNLPIQGNLFSEETKKTYINWNSPSQVLRLFQYMVPKLEDVNGKNLLKHKKNEIIKRYIQYKEQAKLANAYGEVFFKYVNKADGKVHTNFSQILDTGRVSSSKPNMQQIPGNNAYRNCFIAPEGYVFVSSDYSSQELNVIAYGSQDPVWLKALENGQDLHSVCAELVYGQQWLDAAEDNCNYLLAKGKCSCPEHKKLRTNVKTVNFGLAYGMGPKKLAETIEVSMKDAKALIKQYFEAFPAIKGFLDKLGKFGVEHGYIRTFKPFKRRRWFDNWYPKMYFDKGAEFGSIERASKNTPIQGSSADMTKLALVLIHKEITENNLPVKIIMTVHDQIDTICEEGYANTWVIKMTELMETAAKVVIPNGLLKADTNISKTWQK